MKSFIGFFNFLSLVTLICFFFVYATFIYWNKDLKENYGLQEQFLHKASAQDMLEKQGESITFSSPVEYTSELCVHLVGENLVLEQQAKLDKILVEVFYAPPIAGQTYTKVDYQLISQGDRASFVCDKSLWKTWKPDASAQNKLMFAYVRIKIPSSLKNLKIFNAYGSSKVQGNYQQLAFLSYTGSLDFQGSVEKARLETYKGALSLHGKSFEDKQAFYDLTFKTIKGKLIGKGAIKELKLYALWPSVFWQGPCEVFYARSLALESQFELKSLEKGSWSVWAWLGKLLVQVPKGTLRELGENFYKKKYLLGSSLCIDLPISFMTFECKV